MVHNPSNGAKAPFLLWEPFHPVTDNVAHARSIIFVVQEDRLYLIAKCTQFNRVPKSFTDNHVAWMGNQIAKLKARDVISFVAKLQI
jgi:hypothetical protein